MADNDNPRLQDPGAAGEDSAGQTQPMQSDQINAYAIDRLSQAFETSARRWELIVYPSLFAFIILAAYGFYLVFSLAKDVHYLAISVDSNMTVLASNMQSVSDNMGQLTANVRTMAVSVESISRDVSTLEPMLTNLEAMDNSMQAMTYSMHNVRHDMSVMNRNISRPMSFMNTFMPW
jgi:methyl-accepting chemotaxis protein